MSSNYLQRAEAAHQQGNLALAENDYRLALGDEDENKASALYGLGTIALQQGEAAKAAEFLAQARAIEPDAADIGLQYALALHQTGQLEKACAAAMHTAEQCVGDPAFAQPLGKLLLDLNLPAAAVKLLAGCGGEDVGRSMLLARALGALGEWDKSVSVLRQLATVNRGSAQIALALSQAAGKLRDYPLAIASYQQYMHLAKATAHDHLRFADLYLIARDVGHSAEQLEMAAQAGADDAEYYLLRARLARLDGNDALARSASEQALDREAGLGQAWLVRVETADKTELPELLAKMEASVGPTGYQQTLIHYARADANRALGEFEASASALRLANSLQKENLAQYGGNYAAAKMERDHRLIVSQFGCDGAVAEALTELATPLFIVGMPRSGTTLMEKILAQIEGVTACGENEAMGFIATRYRRDVHAQLLPLPMAMTAGQWQQLAKRYYQLTPQSGNFIVDKMPYNFLHVGMILAMFPTAKVIQMRRDPRDVCLSIYSKPFPDGHNYACDPDALAHAFFEAQRMMDHWQQLDSGRVIDVQFEDLVGDPVVGSQRVTDFCGLPWTEECLNFHRSQSASFTFSEKQVRAPVSNKSVGQWQSFEDPLPELFTAIERYRPR